MLNIKCDLYNNEILEVLRLIKIYGKLVKENKIIKDYTAISANAGTYQDNLKSCIIEICNKFDIEKPYWLPSNMDEYNKRNKTIFDKNNFIDEIDFDKFVIEELDIEEK